MPYQSFGVIFIVIKHSSISANFTCIYRPPASTNTFYDEFPDFLGTTLQFQEDLYIEYFNIYLDLSSINTRSFMDILQKYASHQHVSFLTHVQGHWLDLCITRYTCINIKAIFPTDALSDHHCVIIDLWLQVRSRPRKKYITFRPINVKINISTLHDDLANSDLLIQPKSTL